MIHQTNKSRLYNTCYFLFLQYVAGVPRVAAGPPGGCCTRQWTDDVKKKRGNKCFTIAVTITVHLQLSPIPAERFLPQIMDPEEWESRLSRYSELDFDLFGHGHVPVLGKCPCPKI